MKAISQLASPTNASEVRQKLGLLNYYRRFVQNFAIIAEPINRLTRQNVKFLWTNEHQAAFDHLKSALLANGTLATVNATDPLLVKTDASIKGVAGILLQQHDGDWKLVACCARRLSSAEENYPATGPEGLALGFCCNYPMCFIYRF